MTYDELLHVLKASADERMAAFHGGLIKTPKELLLGVKTPVLRKLAKQMDVEELLSFPNEFYEVKFIKLVAVSYLPYERFIQYLDRVIGLIDNWALCDSFKANCIKKHKKEFLPTIEKYHASGKEFSVRYALVCLLTYYVEEKYLPYIFNLLKRTDCSAYYVHMAAAWLTAEILVKHYKDGIEFLNQRTLPPKTHNKAIQKAIESYRLNKEQKEYLKTLKIK